MKKKPYKAYLIRCWHVDPETHPNQNEWRFSLESVDGGAGGRHGFTDPQDLLSFLTSQIEDHEIELITESGEIASGVLPGSNEANLDQIDKTTPLSFPSQKNHGGQHCGSFIFVPN